MVLYSGMIIPVLSNNESTRPYDLVYYTPENVCTVESWKRSTRSLCLTVRQNPRVPQASDSRRVAFQRVAIAGLRSCLHGLDHASAVRPGTGDQNPEGNESHFLWP